MLKKRNGASRQSRFGVALSKHGQRMHSHTRRLLTSIVKMDSRQKRSKDMRRLSNSHLTKLNTANILASIFIFSSGLKTRSKFGNRSLKANARHLKTSPGWLRFTTALDTCRKQLKRLLWLVSLIRKNSRCNSEQPNTTCVMASLTSRLRLILLLENWRPVKKNLNWRSRVGSRFSSRIASLRKRSIGCVKSRRTMRNPPLTNGILWPDTSKPIAIGRRQPKRLKKHLPLMKSRFRS